MARSFTARPARMPKHWDQLGAISQALTADATIISAGLSFDEGWTIIRLLGEYTVAPSGATAQGDSAAIGVGIGVFSSDAVAAGAGSVPEPVNEAEYPWLYWADHRFFFGGTSVDPSPASASVRRAFDVKSMRKVKPRESLVMVVNYVDITGAPPLDFIGGGTRVLIAR